MVPPRPPPRATTRRSSRRSRTARRCRCSCSTRRSGARPDRPAAPTSPRRSAPSTAGSGSGGRSCSVVRGDPVRRVVLAAKAGRRRAGARRRRPRPLRSPPRSGRRAALADAGVELVRTGLAVRRRSRPGHERLGRPLQGLHAVQQGVARPRLARPGRPTHRRELARARRGHHRHPGPGAAGRARPARGRRGRRTAPLGVVPRPGRRLRRGPGQARRRRHLAHVRPPQVG